MKLSASTGDFAGYVESVAEEIACFENTPFRYLNLEQGGPLYLSNDDSEWKRKAEEWGNAAAKAGVSLVLSHSPCVNACKTLDEDSFALAVRAIRRSLEVCHLLGIRRTVVHASFNGLLTKEEFYQQNKRFYGALFDLMEKYDITVMTENMDNLSFYPISTGKEMREFIDYIDHPLFAGCWDTAHANNDNQVKEIGQYQCIVDIGDKLKALHIADNFGDGFHQHTWPFAGCVNFDSVMQGLLDVQYDGYFNFEASYTLLHTRNYPCRRQPWEYQGQPVTKLQNPPLQLKQKAEELLFETGKTILEAYDCFEL